MGICSSIINLLPKTLLCTPPRGLKQKDVVGAFLSSCLQWWQDGDLVALWTEAHVDAKTRRYTDPSMTALANSRRALRMLFQ